MSTTKLTAEQSDALAARAAAGDTGALADLYVAHQSTVMAMVRRHLRGANRADVEDAAQDVWADVCTWIGDVEPEGFLAWLGDLAAVAAERILPSETAEQGRDRFASPLRIAQLRWAVAA
jgi:hypothetical protein